MKLSKGVFALLTSFTAATSVISVGTVVATREPSDSAYVEQLPQSSENVTSVSEKFSVTIRESGGTVGIYSDSGELLGTIPVKVITLPKNERELLKAGIRIESRADLEELIENYTG